MAPGWTVIAAMIAALSSLASVVATVFIVRLTARYARSAEAQAEAAVRQSAIASRSIEALEAQMREMHASETANTVTVVVGVMVVTKVWLRLIHRTPLPHEPKLIFSELAHASQISVQYNVDDAHRMRRMFEGLSIAEGELDVLRQLPDSQSAVAQELRSSVCAHLRAAHEEASNVLKSVAPELVEQIDADLHLS